MLPLVRPLLTALARSDLCPTSGAAMPVGDPHTPWPDGGNTTAIALPSPLACRAQPLTTVRSSPKLPLQPIDLERAYDGRQPAAANEILSASSAAMCSPQAAAEQGCPLPLLPALLPRPFSRMELQTPHGAALLWSACTANARKRACWRRPIAASWARWRTLRITHSDCLSPPGQLGTPW